MIKVSYLPNSATSTSGQSDQYHKRRRQPEHMRYTYVHMKRIFSAVLLFILLGMTVVALNRVDAQSPQMKPHSSAITK